MEDTWTNRTKLWGQVIVPEDCPDDCEYMGRTADAFGTGDSPDVYFCPKSSNLAIAACKNCPVVTERLKG